MVYGLPDDLPLGSCSPLCKRVEGGFLPEGMTFGSPGLPLMEGYRLPPPGRTAIVYGCFCLSFAWTMSYIWIGPYIATHAAQRHQLYTMRPAEQNQKETRPDDIRCNKKGEL